MVSWESNRGDPHLGLKRVWNRLSAISDTWLWGEVTTCASYDTEKMRTDSPKSSGSHFWGQHTSSCPRCVHVLLQASLVSFAVDWSPWNNTTSNSALRLHSGGGHSWCTGQSLCQQNSTFKTFHETKVQITAPMRIKKLLQGHHPIQLSKQYNEQFKPKWFE